MRVDETEKTAARVRFENVAKGENFYFDDKLYVKCSTCISGGRFFECGGIMTDFAVRLSDGIDQSFLPDVMVIPARARVELELYGRFS